jgi:DNA-binding response OmpR family regulator
MKLLLVEDDPDMAIVTRAALKRAGFAVTLAGNGPDAIAAAQRDVPDVILLDWMMPGMDGPEVCRRLKAEAATSGVPVIFLTARSQRTELDLGLSLGAIGYLVKPYDAPTLGAEIKALLQQQP